MSEGLAVFEVCPPEHTFSMIALIGSRWGVLLSVFTASTHGNYQQPKSFHQFQIFISTLVQAKNILVIEIEGLVTGP